MANKTSKIKSKKMVAGRRPRRVRQEQSDDLDLPAIKAMQMFYDPCGADIVPTVYPGDQGYVNRFASTYTTGSAATETNGIVIIKPGNNLNYNGSPTTTAVDFTLSFADTQAPGAGFLNDNATKIRCAGCCAVVRPLASPNNATGLLYYGILPASVVANGAAISVDKILPLLSRSVSVSQALLNPLEVKWSPGTFDDRYSPVAGITSDDDSDRNVLVIVGVGMVAASGFNTRVTALYEWTPQINKGVTIDSTSVKPSRCDFNCVLRNLKRKDADWWWGLGMKTLTGARDIAVAYTTAGVPGAVSSAARFAAKLR